METTIAYWGYIGDNGKENGDYYSGVVDMAHPQMGTVPLRGGGGFENAERGRIARGIWVITENHGG